MRKSPKQNGIFGVCNKFHFGISGNKVDLCIKFYSKYQTE